MFWAAPWLEHVAIEEFDDAMEQFKVSGVSSLIGYLPQAGGGAT